MGELSRAAWWSSLRPKTLVAGLVPVLVGSALAARAGRFRVEALLLAGLGALAIQLIVNLHNELADARRGADAEDRVGPRRGLQSGMISARALKRAIAALLVFAVATGALLTWLAGPPILGIGVASLIAAFLYTGGPYPLAYLGIADVFVLAFFGWAAVLGTVFAHGAPIDLDAFLVATAMGLLSTAILVVNNLRDRHTDARVNKRTLAVRFGAGFARFEYVACLGLAFACLGAVALRGAVGLALAAPLLAPAFLLARRVLAEDGPALNLRLEHTARLLAALGVVSAVGVML